MFETLLGWLTTVAVVLVGLAARALLAVLILAAIVVPIAAALLSWTWLERLADRLSGLQQVGHVRWRRGNYYAPGHLWLRRLRDGAVRVGLDDVAQRVLPDITSVSLAGEGTAVRKGDPLGTIRCLDGSVVLRAPLSGTIAAVNGRLAKKPSLLHRDPYRRAWMVEVRPRNELYRSLPDGERARRWLAREDRHLTHFFEQRLGIAAADGGELILPPKTLLTPVEWEAVRTNFLGQS